jgi:hypothetical protein
MFANLAFTHRKKPRSSALLARREPSPLAMVPRVVKHVQLVLTPTLKAAANASHVLLARRRPPQALQLVPCAYRALMPLLHMPRRARTAKLAISLRVPALLNATSVLRAVIRLLVRQFAQHANKAAPRTLKARLRAILASLASTLAMSVN